MKKALQTAYAWFWFHATLRGPRWLWDAPNGGWTKLALHSFGWAGRWAYSKEQQA